MSKKTNNPCKYTKPLALAGALFLIGLGFCFYSASDSRTLKPTTDAEMSKTSVKIVRKDGRSGGTGVILSSTNTQSKVLTNKHVCEVIKNGGLVISDLTSTAVVSFFESNDYDLCLVTVNKDLKVNTVVAPEAAPIYSSAAISGHPHLMPNVITRGHFTGNQIIEVMLGIRPCTPEEITSDLGVLCMFLGGIPVIRSFDAMAVSATIQPGSSGSAIFNAKGEIAGLVFAGAGDLGYAYAMPLEAVQTFLNQELETLERQVPNNFIDIVALISGENKKKANLQDYCQNTAQDSSQFKTFCKTAGDLLWMN